MQQNVRFALIVLVCAALVALVWFLLHGDGQAPEEGRVTIESAGPEKPAPATPPPAPRSPRQSRVDTGVIGSRTAVVAGPRGEESSLPGVILGRIRGYDGMPATDATVAVLQLNGENPFVPVGSPVQREARTDASGAFEISGLPMGDYSLLAGTTGFAEIEQAHLSVERPTADFDMKLVASGHVAGVVRDAAGEPVAGAGVWALQPTGAERFGIRRTVMRSGDPSSRMVVLPNPVTSGEDGTFRFAGLPEAPTYVLAMPGNAAPALAGPVQPPFDGLDVVVTPGGGIGGLVVLKDNEEPLPGVVVIANGATAQERFESLTTDAGRFGIAALRPGIYELAIDDTRYALTEGMAPRVQVREGETESDVVVRVVPASGIAGRVYDRDTEKPLAGLYVAARGEGLLSTKTVETGSDGAYAIQGLGPGDYRVSVIAPSLRFAAASGAGNEASVTLSEGQALDGLDFGLSFGGVIQGYVVDEGGSPVPYADVTLGTAEGARMRMEKTDAGGFFVYAGLNPGDRLALQARRMNLVSPEPVELDVPAQGAAADVTLTISPGASIRGQVVRSSGGPVEGAAVYITATQASSIRVNDVQPTGSNGTFFWDGLPGGQYMVGAIARGRVEGERPPNVEISVAPGEESAPVKLVWDGVPADTTPLEAGETGNRAIRGRVTDLQGNGIPGVDINARAASGYAHTTKSLHDGTFEIAGIAAGTYQLRAFHRDYAPAEGQEVQAGSSNVVLMMQPPARASGQVVDAATGQPIQEFELAQVSERYLERESSVASLGWQRVFDPEGRFSVDVAMGRDARVMVVKAEGYAPEQQAIGEVAPGQEVANLVFRLKSGAIVEGVVRDAAGNAVSGASIHQGREERRGAALARSDKSGAFRAEGLEGGAVELTASHPSYAPETITVNTRLGAVTTAEFVLSTGGTVEGYVTKSGQAVSRQMVTLTLGEQRQNMTTDATGYYAFERLPAGEGTVAVNLRGESSVGPQYLRAQRSVIVADSSVTRADFEFSDQDAVVEGVITLEGVPASQAYVNLTVNSGGGEQRTGTNTEANGYYRVEHLSPGSARLDVSLRGGRQRRGKTVTFEIKPGQRVRQNIDFGPVSAITGTLSGVRDGEQAHVAVLPGEIEIEKPTLEDVQSFAALLSGYTPVSAEGVFTVQNLEPGTYTVVGVAISGTPGSELEAFANARYVTQVVQVEQDKPVEIALNL